MLYRAYPPGPTVQVSDLPLQPGSSGASSRRFWLPAPTLPARYLPQLTSSTPLRRLYLICFASLGEGLGAVNGDKSALNSALQPGQEAPQAASFDRRSTSLACAIAASSRIVL